MSTNIKGILSFVFIVSAAVAITSCFGPFYTTLATYFKTENNDFYKVEFHEYNIDIHIGAAERDNRKPLEHFTIYLEAKSIHEYKMQESEFIDTVDAIKIDQMCIYTFSNDSIQYPGLFYDTTYSIWTESKHILQGPTWGLFEQVFIPVDDDSIKISFTAILYNDNSYKEILDQNGFSSVLYRKYRKTIPLTR